MASTRTLDPPPVGFWETWLPVFFGDFIILIRLLAYVLLLCTVPSVLAVKVSQFLGTVTAVFLTSVYIFFQMDILEESVELPIRHASGVVENSSSEMAKEYASTLSNKKGNILRRICSSMGKFIDNRKNIPKEIMDNFMIPWKNNKSSREDITGPEITRRKFKILFIILATSVILLILLSPGFNALGPIAISKYLISKAVESNIARFATAVLFGGAIYALRAPLVALGVAIHYISTKDSKTKKRLIGKIIKPETPTEIDSKDENRESTSMFLTVFSPELLDPPSSSPSSSQRNAPSSRPEIRYPPAPEENKKVVYGWFYDRQLPGNIILPSSSGPPILYQRKKEQRERQESATHELRSP